MAVFRIAVIGGDGIGPEVIDQAIRAAEIAVRKHDSSELKWNRLPWSTYYYKKTGRMLPEDGWEQLQPHDAILFGAVGDPSVSDQITVHELLLPMRRKFDQYVNRGRPISSRACRVRSSARSLARSTCWCTARTLKANTLGRGSTLPGTENEVAVQTGVFTPRLRAHPPRRLRRGPQATAQETHEHHQVECASVGARFVGRRLQRGPERICRRAEFLAPG